MTDHPERLTVAEVLAGLRQRAHACGPFERDAQQAYADAAALLARVADREEPPDDAIQKVAERIVQTIADSEPTEETIEAQEYLEPHYQGEQMMPFCLTAEELTRQLVVGISNAFYDGEFTSPLAPPPSEGPEREALDVRFARDCRCGTDPQTGEQVAWCKTHNGWEYGRKMDKLRQWSEVVLRERVYQREGDGMCLPACVSSLTDIPFASWPALTPDVTSGDFWEAVYRVAHSYGWELARTGIAPAGYAIANGDGPRGVRHSVVVCDGRPVHDPYPNGTGLAGEPVCYWIPVRAALAGGLKEDTHEQ